MLAQDRWEVASTLPVYSFITAEWGLEAAGKPGGSAWPGQSTPWQGRGGGGRLTEQRAWEKMPRDESGSQSNGIPFWIKAEERLHYLAHDNSKPSRWKSAVKSSLAWRSALKQVSFSAMQHEPRADQQGNHPVTVAKNTLEQKSLQGRPGLLEHPLPCRPFQSL